MNVKAFLLAAISALALTQTGCQTSSIQSAPTTEGDDIVGVVTGPSGRPEPGVWVIATAYYAAETELFRAVEQAAARRTYALLRGGSALVRYEFEPAGSSQPGSPAAFGRRSTTTSAGR